MFAVRLSPLFRNIPSRKLVFKAAARAASAQKTTSDSDSASKLEMAEQSEDWKQAKSVYEFSANDIDGNHVSLEKYRDQLLIIVNVACKCGFTNKHYKELVELHDKYRAKGLAILGFPCNQFANEEPAPENEIKDFVKQFNVDFDMFSKIEVNGAKAHPLFKYLKEKQGGLLFDAIKWNFTKFIVDRQGQPVGRYGPQTSPRELDEILQKYL